MVLKRQTRRPKLLPSDRLLWMLLMKVWSGWKTSLMIFQPDTLVGWKRAGLRMFRRWKSRHRRGRPGKDAELIGLIRRMWRANPTWGSPRIRDELAQLGLAASTATIRKYRPKSRGKPSQSWRTFLLNHASAVAAMDFFVVPTATFGLLYVLIVINHARRKVVHFNITDAPTAAWTAQQIVNAFPYETAPKYLVARPRFNLRLGLRAARRGHGHQAEADLSEISLAKSLRSSDWWVPFTENAWIE